jgi:hypothetical protein
MSIPDYSFDFEVRESKDGERSPLVKSFSLLSLLVILIGVSFLTLLSASANEAVFRTLLTETVPFSFNQWSSSLKSSDLSVVQSTTGSVKNLQIEIIPDSIQWVRVNRLTLPRVKIRVSSPYEKEGSLSGFGHSYTLEKKGLYLEIPAVSHADAAYEWTIPGVGTGKFWVKITRGFSKSIDSNCQSIRLEHGKLPETGFLSIGCTRVLTRSSQGTVPFYEVEVVSSLDESGRSYRSTQLNAFNPSLEVGDLKIQSTVPNRFRFFSVGAGIGPYLYSVSESGLTERNWIPIPTLYASYFLRDSLRIVSFGSVAPHRKGNADIGLYSWIEQFRGIDDHLSVILLIGARSLVFRTDGVLHTRFTIPQGLELIWREFLIPRYSLHVGGFLYPKNDGRSYTNTWIRFGKSSVFGEVNYIHWRENLSNDRSVDNKSVGLSIGFPLFQL